MLKRWVFGSNTDGLYVKSCTVSLIQPTDNHRPWTQWSVYHRWCKSTTKERGPWVRKSSSSSRFRYISGFLRFEFATYSLHRTSCLLHQQIQFAISFFKSQWRYSENVDSIFTQKFTYWIKSNFCSLKSDISNRLAVKFLPQSSASRHDRIKPVRKSLKLWKQNPKSELTYPPSLLCNKWNRWTHTPPPPSHTHLFPLFS